MGVDMDSRTLKIRTLQNKLITARNFIRRVVIQSIELEDGKTFSKSFWGKEALAALEYTKE